MPVDIPTLAAEPGLELELVCPGPARHGAIEGVHSSDLADPTPFLTSGTLLLTTGESFGSATTAEQYGDYVRGLRRIGAAGLGFGIGIGHADIPQELVDACRREDLALLLVPYATPFLAIARRWADLRDAEARAESRWALAALRSLSVAALRPDGLGETLRQLSRHLHAPVLLLDAAGRILGEAHPERVAALPAEQVTAEAESLMARGRRAAAEAVVGERRVLLHTLGHAADLRGVLAIGGGHRQKNPQRDLVTSVIALASTALAQQSELTGLRAQLRAGVLGLALAGLREQAISAADRWGGLPVEPITALYTAIPDPRSCQRVLGALESFTSSPRTRLFFAPWGSGLLALGASDGIDAVLPVFEKLDLRLGMSTDGGYARLAEISEEARSAWTAAEEAGLSLHRHLPPLRELSSLIDPGRGRAAALRLLGPLLEEEGGAELLSTLRAWLGANGSWQATAQRSGLHRHTVVARVHRAEEILMLSLDDFSARHEVWTAMELLAID